MLTLNLPSDMLARSVAFGIVAALPPIYIPASTLLWAAVARLLGLSIPAAILGIQLGTPIWMFAMVPYIRAGEWFGGREQLALDGLIDQMKGDPMGAFSNFGDRIFLGILVWGISSIPIL